MYVLAVDTSSAVASCSIISEEKLVGEYLINNQLTHSEKTMPMIKDMIANSGVALEEIDYFAVVTGPGSFTGLRIGVATVKALAHVCGKPTVEVSSMEMLSRGYEYFEGIIIPMMDARRQRVFTGAFESKGSEIKQILEDDVLEIDDLLEIAKAYKGNILLTGDAASMYYEKFVDALGERVRVASHVNTLARASWAAEVAMGKIRAGELSTYGEIKPNYLRKSQAEREYDEKHAN